MCCNEESTCDIVGTFWHTPVIRHPGYCSPLVLIVKIMFVFGSSLKQYTLNLLFNFTRLVIVGMLQKRASKQVETCCIYTC